MRISLDHVTKRYGELTVTENLNLVLEEGGAYVLTGASGSGKTTILRMILGLEAPQEGTVSASAGGRTSFPSRKNPLYAGCVFQEDRLTERSSAAANLKAVCRCGMPEIRQALRKLLPEEALDKPVKELSGGMRRRVCLARACLSGADILVLDEPFTGMDEDTRRQAIRFLQEYRRGRTLVLAAHGLEGLEFCEEIKVGEHSETAECFHPQK